MIDDWSGYKIPAVSDEELATMDWQRLGIRLRDRREWLGMTQQALAAKAGVSVGTIQNFEGGRASKTVPYRLTAVVVALGWDPGSGMAIASGGEPVSIETDKRRGKDGDLMFVLTNAPKTGPRTWRALRAVIEADLKAGEGDDND